VKPGRAAYKWQEGTETNMKIREVAQAGFFSWTSGRRVEEENVNDALYRLSFQL
jgi:hypothetical protein